MTKKKLISFSFILLILLLTVGIVSAQDNETQTILENATPVDEGKTFENVQSALDNASENDTIELEGTYLGQGKAINIAKSVTLKSENGATLDAQSKSNILNIANVTVFLKNINFINSRTTGDAAVSSQGNLTIENCNFTGNQVQFSEYENYKYADYGASVYSTNSLTVMNSRFEDNHAESSGIEYEETDMDPTYWEYTYAGAICSQNDAVIENCYFKDSSLICRGDSIIANSTFTKTRDALETSSHARISNCNFTQNMGISIRPNGKTVIGNCNFMNNTNDFTLIYSTFGDVEITDSNFTLSDAISIFSGKYLHVANCRFENNNQTAIKAINATVENSIFTNNKDYLVGGILADYLTVKNCNFTNNMECDVISAMSADVDGKNYTGETAFDNNMNKTALVKMLVKNTAIVYGSGKTPQMTLTFIKSGNKVKEYYIAYNILKNNKRMVVDKWQDYDYVIYGKNGVANFKIPTLNAGSYKIQILGGPFSDFHMKTTIAFKITKAGTIIKAPKVTAKYKKSKYFKVLVKHKTTKKVVKNTYVKIKIDKKTYKVKTDSKGIAKVNTKKLKVGKHKVAITSGNTNYQMSAKSTITIKR